MATVDVMQDFSEIVHYEHPGVPLYIRRGTLSAYPNLRALCHWHDDIELIRMIEGRMQYQVGEKKLLLEQGDTLLINARQMHYGFSLQGRDCTYLCVLFHPNLLAENRLLYRQFVMPFLEKQDLPYLHFRAGTPDGDAFAQLVDRLDALKMENAPAYELAIIGILHLMWQRIYPFCTKTTRPSFGSTDATLQKDMVSYIYQHYTEHLTLADIAAAGHICQSKCCTIFRRYLQQSPIDFLNAYRLEVSCNLLRSTDTTVTDIALACGFNHLSYYSKLFQRKYDCTPTEWRKKYQLK